MCNVVNNDSTKMQVASVEALASDDWGGGSGVASKVCGGLQVPAVANLKHFLHKIGCSGFMPLYKILCCYTLTITLKQI